MEKRKEIETTHVICDKKVRALGSDYGGACCLTLLQSAHKCTVTILNILFSQCESKMAVVEKIGLQLSDAPSHWDVNRLCVVVSK